MLASLFNNVADLHPYNSIKRKTLTQVFPCKYCEMFKDSFFYWTPLLTGPVLLTITIWNSNRALENLRKMNDFNFTNVFSKRVMTCFAKGASYCCFRKAVSNNAFQKILLNFISFIISFLLAFCQGGCFLLIEDYGKNALRKELVIAPFVVRFKTATLRKSSWWISLAFTVIC